MVCSHCLTPRPIQTPIPIIMGCKVPGSTSPTTGTAVDLSTCIASVWSSTTKLCSSLRFYNAKIIIYRPLRSCARLYFYTCLSFCPKGGVYLSMHWDTPPCPVHAGIHPRADTPLGRYPPPNGHWSGRYASYWNAFLWISCKPIWKRCRFRTNINQPLWCLQTGTKIYIFRDLSDCSLDPHYTVLQLLPIDICRPFVQVFDRFVRSDTARVLHLLHEQFSRW